MAYKTTCATCRELEELLFLLADGELDADTQERLQVHLDGCESCQTLMDVEMHLRQLIKHCYQVECPQELKERIRQQILGLEIGRL